MFWRGEFQERKDAFMFPRTRLMQRFREKIRKILAVLFSIVAMAGVLVPVVKARAQEQPPETLEVKKGLVILVEFPGQTPPVNRDFVRQQFRKLDFYVREMSYGRVRTEVDITDWYRLPEPVANYAISPANLKVDKTKVVRLIQDSIDAAERDNDFSRYSFIVLFLGGSFRDYGMVGLCGYPGMLGWEQNTILKSRNGQVVPGGVAIFTFQAHLGTLFHDIAHIWGGVRNGKRLVPCLYDHDLQAKHATNEAGFSKALINMGYWDPMSCHFFRREAPPPGLSSWTKLRLGWIREGKVRTVDPGKTVEILLGPLEERASETLVIKIPLSESTYYLVENRQPIGVFDSNLPGKGVLIMFADDRIAECRNGKSPVKLAGADPSVPDLRGAAFGMGGKTRFVDEKNNLEIVLLEEVNGSFRVRVGPVR